MGKFVTNIEAKRFLDISRSCGKMIIMTNGCFDILHLGHVRYLKESKKCGDRLLVTINSDESIKTLKGKFRPIMDQYQRAEILAALECVDYVTIFDDLTPIKIIESIKPDFLIKGSDWTYDNIVGKDFVESYGGKVIRIKLVEGISTTKIIEKILNNE